MSGLEDIPENCVALVLMHMDPPEICKLAGVNRLFRGAASADFIWESKLPSNYQFLLDKAMEFEEKEKALLNLRKKDVYSRLCKRNSLNGVSKVSFSLFFLYLESLWFGLWTLDWFRVFELVKEFWLDKRTGGLSMAISWKALTITGIDDRRYWNHISTEESRWEDFRSSEEFWFCIVVEQNLLCLSLGLDDFG